MAGSSSAAARVPFGRLGDAAQLKRFASAFGLPPREVIAGREVFDSLYGRLPGRFPPLFEQLVTGFSWDGEIDVGPFRLLPNPPGADLSCLEEAMLGDPGTAGILLAAGHIPFAQGQDSDDPVCFDTERRRNDRDCPIVRISREGLAVRQRIEIVEEIAPSFRALLERQS